MKLVMVDTPTEEKIEMDQERSEWRYHVTMNTAEVVIGNTLTLRPDWHVPMSPEEIRAVVRMAAAAPALYAIAKEALQFREEVNGRCDHDGPMTHLCTQCEIRAALALVDGPLNKETK